jgi:transcription antitermination factor NusG
MQLTDREFEAYAAAKWRSNAFNRERLEVKEKLLGFGRELAGGLTAADGSPLSFEASVEHPALWNQKQVDAQHVFFYRNEAARRELDRIIDRGRTLAAAIEDPSPQRTHLFLAVTIAFDRMETALRLHGDAAVDRQNLDKKLAEPWQREDFVALVRGLPGGFRIGVVGGPDQPTGELTEDTLAAILAELEAAAAARAARWFYVAEAIARADALAAGEAIGERVRSGLAALLPLYQFIAWTRENDHVSMREQLRERAETRKRRGLVKNDRVRVITGMFAGRIGVVQEVDGKGAVKLLVGNIPVKLKAEDVEKQ